MSIIEVTGNPRHDQLVHLIAERGYMNIEELAQLLDVSTQTVRRDIRKLSEQGLDHPSSWRGRARLQRHEYRF